MVQLMETMKHEHLIRIEKSEMHGEDQVLLYYEYVPLTLEKWVLDLGEDFLNDI